MQKSLTIFDHLNNITYDKGPYLGDENWNIWMINRFLSMDEDYCEVVNILQKNFRIGSYISNELMYLAYRDIIPKQKKFLKYIKAKNKETYDGNELKAIAQYFEISESEARYYSDNLMPEVIEKIKNQTGYGA